MRFRNIIVLMMVWTLSVSTLGAVTLVEPGSGAARVGRVYFPQSGRVLDRNFRENGQVLDELCDRWQTLAAEGVDTVFVRLIAWTSQEGHAKENERIAMGRSAAVRSCLREMPHVPVLVFSTEYVNYPQKGVLPDVAAAEDMRMCEIVWSSTITAPEPTPEPTPSIWEEQPDVVMEETSAPTADTYEEDWSESWYLKTNFLTYPLNLTANLGFEAEIGRHFSLSVPFYYSALNWFRSDVKFRILGTQPEFRYWFGRDFTGWFVGLHGSFGWYNVAVGGRYRYQDHSTESPAYGGGLTGGYRLPLGKNYRWALEFTLGAGYLNLYYDTFYNIPNGALAQEGLRKHYFGPDHAAVTLSYRLGKRRGK